jgi:hypothetical protein
MLFVALCKTSLRDCDTHGFKVERKECRKNEFELQGFKVFLTSFGIQKIIENNKFNKFYRDSNTFYQDGDSLTIS